MAVGGLNLVLHGHMPYVLRHGVWPHGEDWLYEVAAQTYLPLLEMIGHCVLHEASPQLSIGLTPVLLEQMAHDDFKIGLDHYLDDRINRAQADGKVFADDWDNAHMARLAEYWSEHFSRVKDYYHRLDRNIPAAFSALAQEGHLVMLGGPATHPFMPLVYDDASLRAQLSAGRASLKHLVGTTGGGCWLPECAYRPGGSWAPSNSWAGKGYRASIEQLVADAGYSHLFVDSRTLRRANSEQVFHEQKWWKIGWDEKQKYPGRAWCSPLEVHGINSMGQGSAPLAGLAGARELMDHVWNRGGGFPADGAYLDFTKQFGRRRGLRYWQITGAEVDPGDKHLYYPENVAHRIHEQATHFCNLVKQQLWAHHDSYDRYGVISLTFDAELFGHWWFEGLDFLRDVLLTLNADPDVDLLNSDQAIERGQIDKVVSLPEGSWSEEGGRACWADDSVQWMWDVAYRCESQFLRAVYELPWEARAVVKEHLEKAGRELLLLQSSDWMYMVGRGTATDYGIKRFMQHVTRFENLLDLSEKLTSDTAYLGKATDIEIHEVASVDLHDVIFKDIDLSWWSD